MREILAVRLHIEEETYKLRSEVRGLEDVPADVREHLSELERQLTSVVLIIQARTTGGAS
jgi:hypothetical protein